MPAGVDVSATPSHQEAVAVPYVAGEYVLPASWTSPSYNEHDVSLPSESGGKGGGKGGSSSASTQWKRYATVAMIWHVGVAGKLTGLILNDALVWSGNITRTPGVHYVEISIEGRGLYRHYWGTQTTTDPLLTPGGNNYGDDHPSYEGCCYGILVDFLYGVDTEQAPAVRIRGERTPVQPYHTGVESLNDDGQANLICVAGELLHDTRFGLSMPVSFCSVNSWRAAIEKAYARRDLCFCSPLIQDHQTLRSFLDELFSIDDLFLRPDPVTGLLECGFYPSPEEIDPEALVTIEQADLLEEHEMTPGGWDDVKNTWNVSFRDRDYVMKENQVSDFDQRALDIHLGETRSEDVQARPIVRKWQAQRFAALKKHRLGVPGLDGSIKVDAELVESVYAGDHIRTDIDLRPGGLSLQQVFRVLRIKRTARGVAELTLEAERTLAPLAYNVPIVPRLPDPEKDEIPELGVSRFFELPWQNYSVGILVARTDGLQSGFAIHYDRNVTGTYQTVASSGGTYFALKARLTEAIPSDLDPAPVKLELIGSLDRELIATDPGDVAARDDQLLLILVKTVAGQIAADADGLAFLEVLSCQNFVVTAPNQITATALRGRQKSAARPFDINTEAWLVRRSDLPIVDHADFASLAVAADTAYFKLQAAKLRDLRPLEDCTARPFTFALARNPASDRLRYLERRYKRTVSQPDAPTVADPADWFVSMAEATGIGSLWASEAYKYQDDNSLVGSWSVPVKLIEDPQIFENFEAQLTVLQQEADQLALDIAAEATARGTSISQEQSAREAADAAETNARTLAIATLQNDLTGKASVAALDTESATRATADTAETTARETAISQVQDALDGKASLAALDAESATRATADAAETTARQTAVSQLQNDLTGKASVAALDAESTTRATADAAETETRETAISELTDYVSDGLSTALAAVQTESTTRATADTALSSQISTVGSQVGTVSAAVTTQAQALATLAGDAEARYGVNVETNIDGNKVIAGFEIVSKAGSTPVSQMRLKAGMDLMSEDYVPGVSGWIKKGNGDDESNNGLFRGRLQAAKIATDNQVYHPSYPEIILPATSSAYALVGNSGDSFTLSLITLVGVGAKAADPATTSANLTYWTDQYNSRLAAYNTLYDSYAAEGTGSDGHWEYDPEPPNAAYWVVNVTTEHQALLDAQMALVNEAQANVAYWTRANAATGAAIANVFGRSHVTFLFSCGCWFDLINTEGGDFQPLYRINGGGWNSVGWGQGLNSTRPDNVLTFPVTLDLAITDVIEFGVIAHGVRNAANVASVYWSNQ